MGKCSDDNQQKEEDEAYLCEDFQTKRLNLTERGASRMKRAGGVARGQGKEKSGFTSEDTTQNREEMEERRGESSEKEK